MYRRLSPAVLISMMELASRESAEFHQSLDPMAEAAFGVSWAGEETSLNWFDTARELTERWHHQQQIRLATNRPGIMTRELYYPVLDCFMRALPFKYRDKPADPGTHLRFNVSGECGGSWYLYRDGDRWVQVETPQGRQAIGDDDSAGDRVAHLHEGHRAGKLRRRRCRSPAIATLALTC